MTEIILVIEAALCVLGEEEMARSDRLFTVSLWQQRGQLCSCADQFIHIDNIYMGWIDQSCVQCSLPLCSEKELSVLVYSTPRARIPMCVHTMYTHRDPRPLLGHNRIEHCIVLYCGGSASPVPKTALRESQSLVSGLAGDVPFWVGMDFWGPQETSLKQK